MNRLIHGSRGKKGEQASRLPGSRRVAMLKATNHPVARA